MFSQVRWEQEEEDFEGFVKRLRPNSKYCYEVAYDDGDEEWGWFSDTHFHTDEVQRRYTWLQEQDEKIAQAAAKALAAVEGSKQTPASAESKALDASAERTGDAAALQAATVRASGAVGNLAQRKDQLRAIQDVRLDSKTIVSAASPSSSHDNGLQQTSSQPAHSDTAPSLPSASQRQPTSLSQLVPSGAERASLAPPAASDATLTAAARVKGPIASIAQPTALTSEDASADRSDSKAMQTSKGSLDPVKLQEPDSNGQLLTAGSMLQKVSASAAAKLQLDAGQHPSKQVIPNKKRKAIDLQEPSSSMDGAQDPASVTDGHAGVQMDDEAVLAPAVQASASSSLQTRTANQEGTQPVDTPMSPPKAPELLADASKTAEQPTQRKHLASAHDGASQQQYGDAPLRTKRPSPEKNAKQKAAAERRIKHAHDVHNKAERSPVEEKKRRRLKKASELETMSEAEPVKLAIKPHAVGLDEVAEPDNTDVEDAQVRKLSSPQRLHVLSVWEGGLQDGMSPLVHTQLLPIHLYISAEAGLSHDAWLPLADIAVLIDY